MNMQNNSTIAICLTAILALSPVASFAQATPRSAVKPWLCGQMRWGFRSRCQIREPFRLTAGI